MNFLITAVVASSLVGSCLANTNEIDQSIAYHAVTAPKVVRPLASPAMTITNPAVLVDPVPTAISPANASVVAIPAGHNSLLETTTAMIGIIGMLILVFRRRIDTA